VESDLTFNNIEELEAYRDTWVADYEEKKARKALKKAAKKAKGKKKRKK